MAFFFRLMFRLMHFACELQESPIIENVVDVASGWCSAFEMFALHPGTGWCLGAMHGHAVTHGRAGRAPLESPPLGHLWTGLAVI